MSWSRITTPKNIERLREYELGDRWYVKELKAAEVFRDTELLWQLRGILSKECIVLIKRFDKPESVAEATEDWKSAMVISGRKYIAKIQKSKRVVRMAIVRL